VSGSWAGDAQERQGSGGVAGVAAQDGGDVAVAAGAEDADGQVAEAGPWPEGRCRVRTWAASSAKATSRMWCNASMPQWPGRFGQAGGAGLGGVGEVQAGHGGDLQTADLHAAVPAVAGLVHHGDVATAGWRAGSAGWAGYP
jgi:hypothetical protein